MTYAASIARAGRDELEKKLKPGLGEFGDANRLSNLVRRELDREGDTREVAVLFVGTGIDPGLERVNEFLSRFGVPIGVVSFEVFKLAERPKLLIREVVEEPVPRPTPRRRFTVEAVRRLAAEECVQPQFDRFLKIARDVGLAVQPHSTAVRIAPPANRTRFLMLARPREGGMTISTSAAALVEILSVNQRSRGPTGTWPGIQDGLLRRPFPRRTIGPHREVSGRYTSKAGHHLGIACSREASILFDLRNLTAQRDLVA